MSELQFEMGELGSTKPREKFYGLPTGAQLRPAFRCRRMEGRHSFRRGIALRLASW